MGQNREEGDALVKMSTSQKTFSFFLCFFFVYLFCGGVMTELEANSINLPKRIGHWTKPDAPRVVDANTIFDYMNGAGELYLGYRFDHLEVFDYTIENNENILAELYFMKTPDDAFGLLSLDWGGEPVYFISSPATTSNQSVTFSTRALYGAGLLRIWSDNLYARVLAYRDTPVSKQAVLALGKAIAANRKRPPEPELLKILPLQIHPSWKLRKDRLSFFRSYLVLNSIYYISEGNILNLDHSTEAVTAPYEHSSSSNARKRSQFLIVKYESKERAQKALNKFHDAYLPEHKKEIAAHSVTKSSSLFKIEDGWLAYRLIDNYVAIVFECPDQESARLIIQKNASNIIKHYRLKQVEFSNDCKSFVVKRSVSK
jgi:hypothetical protein